MNRGSSDTDAAWISVAAARVTIAAAGAVLVLLACLHVLSPEFDPSWRVVSEYANGRNGWALSFMFISWALSSWALVVALWSQLNSTSGKIGLGLLFAAGVGQAMASVCDIKHPLHNLAGAIGVLSLPVAAMLISLRLGRTEAWCDSKRVLLWTANLTWVSLVVMFASLIVMARGLAVPGYKIAPGVVRVVGWANRFLVLAYCVWVVVVAWQIRQLHRRTARPISPGDSHKIP